MFPNFCWKSATNHYLQFFRNRITLNGCHFRFLSKKQALIFSSLLAGYNIYWSKKWILQHYNTWLYFTQWIACLKLVKCFISSSDVCDGEAKIGNRKGLLWKGFKVELVQHFFNRRTWIPYSSNKHRSLSQTYQVSAAL